VLLTAAGCDPTDKHYYTQGVGTRLTSDEIHVVIASRPAAIYVLRSGCRLQEDGREPVCRSL
jgi:hypothetical protein